VRRGRLSSPPSHRLERSERLSKPVKLDLRHVLDRTVARLAVLASVLLAVLDVGRLTVLDPEANVIKATALISGLVVNPAFFLLFARSLPCRHRPAREPPRSLAACPGRPFGATPPAPVCSPPSSPASLRSSTAVPTCSSSAAAPSVSGPPPSAPAPAWVASW